MTWPRRAHAGKQPLAVIERAFGSLPPGIEHRRFRGDSACYENRTLQWLAAPEHHIERFTVSADLSAELRKRCEQVPDADWQLYEEREHETLCFAEVEFAQGDWPKSAQPLRTIVLRIAKRQGELFANGSDRFYLGVVSNDATTDAPTLLHWHYRKAGHIEIVHDVLKNGRVGAARSPVEPRLASARALASDSDGAGVLPCGAFGANGGAGLAALRRARAGG